jgi:hypothetical protein
VATPKRPHASSIYQLKVTLKGSKPPIWRRLQLRGDTRLSELHDILQLAMGWGDAHLHQFTAGEQSFGRPDADDWTEVRDERQVVLSQVARAEKARLGYEYDFGDSWEHQLLVEKILPPEPGKDYPVCVAGKRACPPEDVGGIWGYADFLAAIRDPEHREHKELLEWIGGAFDPEAFDLEAVNAALQRLQ